MNDHPGKLDEMYICLLAPSLLMFLPMLGWRLMALFGWFHLHYIYEPPRLPRINTASLAIEDTPGLAAEADGQCGRK